MERALRKRLSCSPASGDITQTVSAMHAAAHTHKVQHLMLPCLCSSYQRRYSGHARAKPLANFRAPHSPLPHGSFPATSTTSGKYIKTSKCIFRCGAPLSGCTLIPGTDSGPTWSLQASDGFLLVCRGRHGRHTFGMIPQTGHQCRSSKERCHRCASLSGLCASLVKACFGSNIRGPLQQPCACFQVHKGACLHLLGQLRAKPALDKLRLRTPTVQIKSKHHLHLVEHTPHGSHSDIQLQCTLLPGTEAPMRDARMCRCPRLRSVLTWAAALGPAMTRSAMRSAGLRAACLCSVASAGRSSAYGLR